MWFGIDGWIGRNGPLDEGQVVELDMSVPFGGAMRISAPETPVAGIELRTVRGQRLRAGYRLAGEGDGIAECPARRGHGCGRLRECRQTFVYNLLCDISGTPPRASRTCGRIAMARVPPLDASGGYQANLIAGGGTRAVSGVADARLNNLAPRR